MNGARPHTDTQGYKYKETWLVLFYWGRRGGGAGQDRCVALPYQLLLLLPSRTCDICRFKRRAPNLNSQSL